MSASLTFLARRTYCWVGAAGMRADWVGE